MSNHEVILVALAIDGTGHNDGGAFTRDEAMRFVMANLPQGGSQRFIGRDSIAEVSWWIAEDDRTDGSDNDSAVFVHPGMQAGAASLLHEVGMTGSCNLVTRTGGQFTGSLDTDEVSIAMTQAGIHPTLAAKVLDILEGSEG